MRGLPTQWRMFLFLVLLPALSVGLSGQTSVDSLKQVRRVASHDTLKIKTDILIGQRLRRSSLDSSRFYLERALSLSKRNVVNFPHLEGQVLRALAEVYRLYGDERGLDFYRKAISVFERLDSKRELAFTQSELGKFFEARSEFDSSTYHYERVIERNLADGTDYWMARSYNNAGLDYYYMRKLAKASRLLLDGIRYIKSTTDTMSLRAFYMNYGLVLERQDQYELSKEYMKRALFINLHIGNKRSAATAYTNIGQTLIKQDSLDKAFESLTKGWELAREVNPSTWPTADYYKNLGRIEFLKGNFQESHDYLVKSVTNLPDGVAPQSRGDIYGSLVEQKMILADSVFSKKPAKRSQLWKEALPYAIEGWELAERSGAGNVRYRLALAQANLYSRLNDFERAYKFSHLAMLISEDINDQAKTDAIARMSAEFETELIEAQNTLLRETQKVQTAQLRQQDYLIYGAIVALVLILIIGSIIYRSRLKLQKANEVVQKSLSEKELLLKEIHHRVKNNLQVVSSLLDLQSRGIEDEAALATFMEGQNRVKAMALIHQKLYQNENLATIDFAEYAGQLMKELATLYPAAKGVETTVKAEGLTHFDIDTAVPLGLILNELISNAYKYAFEGSEAGELTVSVASLGEGKHQLTVTDSGAGLPDSFDFKKAKSLGLKLVRRLSKQLYGSVEYQWKDGASFVVSFSDTQLRKAL